MMSNKVYLYIIQLLVTASSGNFCFAQGKITDVTRPNIILIMADDMGYSDLGCYGSEIPTPNLDKLANMGIRFSQFYNTARCCPTRASLLTGLAPHQAGIGHMTEEPGNTNANWGTPGYGGNINDRCITIAEALQSAGYHTYMTGKWHLGYNNRETWPLQRGFEKYYGILAGASSYFKPHGLRGLTHNNTQLPPPDNNYYTTDAFADSAIAFVQQQKDARPFFLYLAFNAPHWPLQAKEEDIKQFEGWYAKGWDVVRGERYQRQLRSGVISWGTKLTERDSSVRPWNELTQQEQKDVAYRMAVYAAQISSMDQNIGKLMHSLKQSGKDQNTLIVFLSDNGACPEPYKELGGGKMEDINNENLWGAVSYGTGWANVSNTPYRKWKREMEEGGIVTPLIICWPNGMNQKMANTINSTPSYLIDVMPTFLELANAGYPSQFNGNDIHLLEGRSLVPALKGEELAQHEYMFWEHEGNQAVRKANWKAIKDDSRQEWELYDLEKDRSEENNLARQYPEILNELVARWHEWSISHNVFPKRKDDIK